MQEAREAEPGYPVQLVWTDGNGRLHLDESVVYDCFMSPRCSGYPVYLLGVIGEKRRGKSFLMNYIMRALESQVRHAPRHAPINWPLLHQSKHTMR